MFARIFVPAKSAVQSGRAASGQWMLEYEPEQAIRTDPLMGWSGSGDMRAQIRMKFPSREAAENYAKRNGIPYQIEEEPAARRVIRKSYSDNFRYGRKHAWTH